MDIEHVRSRLAPGWTARFERSNDPDNDDAVSLVLEHRLSPGLIFWVTPGLSVADVFDASVWRAELAIVSAAPEDPDAALAMRAFVGSLEWTNIQVTALAMLLWNDMAVISVRFAQWMATFLGDGAPGARNPSLEHRFGGWFLTGSK